MLLLRSSFEEFFLAGGPASGAGEERTKSWTARFWGLVAALDDDNDDDVMIRERPERSSQW